MSKTLAELPAYAALELFRGLSVQFIHSGKTLDVFIKTMTLITLTDSWREFWRYISYSLLMCAKQLLFVEKTLGKMHVNILCKTVT